MSSRSETGTNLLPSNLYMNITKALYFHYDFFLFQFGGRKALPRLETGASASATRGSRVVLLSAAAAVAVCKRSGCCRPESEYN